MLNQNVDVTFSYNYGYDKLELKCDWVKYGIELLGEVFEDIDWNLIEDYKDARQIITLKVRLTFAEAQFIGEFLKSTAKKITIDGVKIEVVNADKEYDFPLFKNSFIAAHPTLTFKKKDKG